MTNRFPVLTTEQEAEQRCSQCQQELVAEDAQDIGYPPGHGQYRMKCRKCGFSLYYDRALGGE